MKVPLVEEWKKRHLTWPAGQKKESPTEIYTAEKPKPRNSPYTLGRFRAFGNVGHQTPRFIFPKDTQFSPSFPPGAKHTLRHKLKTTYGRRIRPPLPLQRPPLSRVLPPASSDPPAEPR